MHLIPVSSRIFMSAIFATYDDISDCWPIFKHNIDGFFPLRNVHKPKLIGTPELNSLIRNIPVINIKFIPLKAELLSLKTHLNIHERPFLHIFIGFCEDIDAYRQKFRPKLKSWFESISNKKSSQFIIILLENQTYSDDAAKSGKTFLLDKIRFDFSDKLTFRLISLKITPGENLSSLPECVDLISDCIYHSAVMHLSQMDEDIRKMSAQRNMPGWNFFTFFLTKESKALTLSDFGLFSESLAVYDELDTLFMEINATETDSEGINTKNVPEFIIQQDETFNGADISISNWSKFRQKIYENQISLYEFQLYNFSRQLNLLLEMKDFLQILKRCKYFICTAMFLQNVDGPVRKQWIFDVIFAVIKMLDLNSQHLDINNETSNCLSDLLLLANDQIEGLCPDFSDSLNDSDQMYDLAHIISISNSISTENCLQFRISVMKYCLEILKKSSSKYKSIVIMMKLARLYCDAKMFNVSLEALQEASDQIISRHWPKIKVMILELSCACYWNLRMNREYLRKYFELISIKNSRNILNDDCDKIYESVLKLDDTLIMEFDNFFRIDDLVIKDSLIRAMFSSIFVLPFRNCEVSFILSGESQDINWNSSVLKLTGGDQITIDMPLQNDIPPGLYKLKKLVLKFDKLSFESVSVSNLWAQDINVVSDNKLIIDCYLPDLFDLDNPVLMIRCENKNAYEINDLSISVESPYLKLVPISDTHIFHKNNISPNDFILIKYAINEYSPGKKSVKIRASFKIDSKTTDSFDLWAEIDIPKPWNVEIDCLQFTDSCISTYRVVPEFGTSNIIKFFDICSGCPDAKNDPIFEIEKGTSLHISKSNEPDLKSLLLTYANEYNHKIKTISIPINPPVPKSIYCMCIPKIGSEGMRIGIPVQFDVAIDSDENIEFIKYSISFNSNEWMLSGSSNGFAKTNWYFVMIPIVSGLIQLPTLLFTAPLMHVITNGSTMTVV